MQTVPLDGWIPCWLHFLLQSSVECLLLYPWPVRVLAPEEYLEVTCTGSCIVERIPAGKLRNDSDIL